MDQDNLESKPHFKHQKYDLEFLAFILFSLLILLCKKLFPAQLNLSGPEFIFAKFWELKKSSGTQFFKGI
jgi:hypothetical protein